MRQWLWIAVLGSLSCGRETIIATGSEGGRCYGNESCDPGLFCSGSDLCVAREPGAGGCTGSECTGPTDGMVLIEGFPGGDFWIDVYEASVVGGVAGFHDQDQDDDGKIASAEVAAAHAQSHGMVFDDDGGEENVTLTTRVARSVPFVLPATAVSLYQAMAACTNAGKRLCSPAEWLWACRGSEANRYPYGEDYDGGDEPGVDCWTNGMIDGSPQPTGTASACVTPTGVFDMSGNVWELTDYIDPWTADARGGEWQTGSGGSRCGAVTSEWAGAVRPDEPSDTVGFRCCRPR